MTAERHEMLKEGWVEFRRFYFQDGYIDYWVGDMINNPNNDKKKPFNLNAFATYFRRNGTEWIRDPHLRGGTSIATANSAEEFWTNYIEK